MSAQHAASYGGMIGDFRLVELPGIEPGWERRSRGPGESGRRAWRGGATERSGVELPGIEPGSPDLAMGLLRA